MNQLLKLLLLAVLFWPLPLAAETLSGEVRWSGVRQIREKVLVAKDAKLTIAPGSQLEFIGGSLEVAGTLLATDVSFSGDNWPGIVLTRNNQETILRGSRISGAQTGIFIAGGNPQLQQLIVENNQVGIELKQQSRAVVRDCRFLSNSKVGLFIKEGSAARITGNQFTANGRYGAYIFRSVPEVFQNNRFDNNATGLMIAYFGSDPLITGNFFTGNQVGIHTDRSAKPVLQGNLLRDNQVGIKLQRRSDALVQGNRLQNNQQAVAVLFSSYPKIVGNDFSGNQMALTLEHQSAEWERENGAASRQQAAASRGAFGTQPRQTVTEEQRQVKNLIGTVDARGNWWGESTLGELQKTGADGNLSFVHDGRDQASFHDGGKDYPLDLVEYYPVAQQPQFSEGQQ